MNWNSIASAARMAAEANGHSLSAFKKRGLSQIKMASCTKCYGCCWIAWHPAKAGFIAGGRLLKYKCGTPEAAGLK